MLSIYEYVECVYTDFANRFKCVQVRFMLTKEIHTHTHTQIEISNIVCSD